MRFRTVFFFTMPTILLVQWKWWKSSLPSSSHVRNNRTVFISTIKLIKTWKFWQWLCTASFVWVYTLFTSINFTVWDMKVQNFQNLLVSFKRNKPVGNLKIFSKRKLNFKMSAFNFRSTLKSNIHFKRNWFCFMGNLSFKNRNKHRK